MSWDDDVAATRRRIAEDIGGRWKRFDADHAVEKSELQEAVAEGVRPALDAAEKVMEEANPGSTISGSPLGRRGLAGWESSAWTDTSLSAAHAGVGGLVRI